MAQVTTLSAHRLPFTIVAACAILVCSVVFGIAFRAGMRAVALINGFPPEFHLEVSLVLAGLAALLGAGLGSLFVLIGSGFPSTSWTRKGLIFALIVFVCPTVPFLILARQMQEAPTVSTYVIFGAMLPLYALGLGALLDALDPRPSPQS